MHSPDRPSRSTKYYAVVLFGKRIRCLEATFHERHETVMAEAIYLYFGGLVALAVGFALYLYRRRQRHEEFHTPLICRTSLDKDGNLIRFILCPRSIMNPVPVVPFAS